MDIETLIKQLADKKANRTEADVQANVRRLLLDAPFDLSEDDLDVRLESAVGDRRRIDVEIGATVFEVKKDLRKGNVLRDAVDQLRGYVEARTNETGQTYVGILTDGAEWLCFHLSPTGDFAEVSKHVVNGSSPDVEALVLWLDGVLATKQGTHPTPTEIERRLGADSSSYAVDRATLAGLYEQNKHLPTVQMKRTLWARLLTTALGSQFQNNDDLFVEHTLLVNSAETIAHAVIGFDVNVLSPISLLSGSQFKGNGIYGVVELDFFDWVLEVPHGDRFIRSIARKIGRFDWREVSYDVMKVLYESVIRPEIRKQLGEYYTPDWLAKAVVSEVVDKPLEQRVLDPACGSGTFLFHAVRQFLEEAERQKMPVGEALATVTRNVIGFDIHPVAITLARVTYLLAIGRERLIYDRKNLVIPVYLGDSMQWQQKPKDLFTADDIVIETNDVAELINSRLRFPRELLKSSRLFDELIIELADKAAQSQEGNVPSLAPQFTKFAIPSEHQTVLQTTFERMCELHHAGRDHIWGYYIRNLVRPAWLEVPENRVDRLIGNPPWLSFRYMPDEMQTLFKMMSQNRQLWHGAKMATHQDLSALFVAKTVQMYLKEGGKFGFVMPNSVIDRDYFAGFREGAYPAGHEETMIQFGMPWDLRRIRPHIFPRGSAVIFGTRSTTPKQLPTRTQFWSGSLHEVESQWRDVEAEIERTTEDVTIIEQYESPYRSRFMQGATVVPRILFMVERKPLSFLGMPSDRRPYKSKRSAYEKEPWKSLPDIDMPLEPKFVRPIYSGQSIVPFRTLSPEFAVIPWNEDVGHLMGDDQYELSFFEWVFAWWRKADTLWKENRSSDRLTLQQRLDYRSGLTKQFPIQPKRIVYASSGMHICAARLFDEQAVIDNKLYWATINVDGEGHYLCAVLNAEVTTMMTRPLMSYGKDERDIHKHVWKLNIPKFDPASSLHQEIAALGARIEEMVDELPLRDVYFASIRKDVRKFVRSTDEGQEMEKLVEMLL